MIIGLVGKAYTLKSTIARILEEQHGFVQAGFSDYLKWLTCDALAHISPDNHPSYEEMLANKAKYRRLYQEVGSAIGYDTDPKWIQDFIHDLPAEVTGTGWMLPTRHCVIDCLRSLGQVEGAHRAGAKVIGIDATYASRVRFAAGIKGIAEGRMLVDAADDHPIDGLLDLSAMPIDLRVITDHRSTAEAAAEEIARWVDEVAEIDRKHRKAEIEALEAFYGYHL